MKCIAGEIGEMAILGQLQGRMIRHLYYEEPDCRVRCSSDWPQDSFGAMAMGKLALSQTTCSAGSPKS